MGDCGNLFLGFVLCWFANALSQGDRSTITLITAVWLLGLPIIDTGNAVVNGGLRRQSRFVANRDHLQYVLLTLGFSFTQPLWMLLAAGAAMGCIGLVGHWFVITDWVMFLCFVGLLAIYTTVFRLYWRKRYQKWLMTGHERRRQSHIEEI